MGLLSSLFGKSQSDENEQEKQDKKNFDILKYDGIRARNMGKLDYAIKCFEEAVALNDEKRNTGTAGQRLPSGQPDRRCTHHPRPARGKG